MCNEAFEGWPFAQACQAIRKAGYTGIEIAPFTLAEKPGGYHRGRTPGYREIIQSEGLSFVGLHWLMVSPKGLHVSGPDAGCAAKLGAHPRI
jgi:D-psicose/D-tagatose/L-ribulose 3-epimerase